MNSRSSNHSCHHIELLEDRRFLAADLLISELQADNVRTLRDRDGDNPSWIELYNAGDEPADLTGWKLTDDAAEPDRWEMSAITLEAGAYLTVFASGKDRTPGRNTRDIHTNFQLNPEGGFIGLVQPNGTIKQNIEYPEQWPDQSFGLSTSREEVHFITPSPGRANALPAAPAPHHCRTIGILPRRPTSDD